jgi:hypothetical protein
VSSLRTELVCCVLALSASGCGNALYAMRAGRVSSELQLAEQAGAAESAPYEYFFAAEHLRKARSEAAESDFGDALSLLAAAEESTRLARDRTPMTMTPASSAVTSTRRLPSEVARLEQLAFDAEQRGARRCAPRELAIGRSQLEFAKIEDAQGFASKANEHLRLAEQNVQAARLLSSAEHCGAQPTKVGPVGGAPSSKP